jgi:hypothetical protein
MRKRHEVDRQKLEAWSMTFGSGYDFFSDLEPAVIDPVHVWPPSKVPAAELTFLTAAREAWAELGERFLETWTPVDEADRPWALTQFGSPSGPLKKPKKLRR